MASDFVKQPCIKCDKGGGILTCIGCHHWFCTKHLLEHRQELANQMDHIGQEHDVLQRDLFQENGNHPLIRCINDWEQQSIKKIQLAAEQARKDLQQYLDNNKTLLKTSLSQITTDLQARREFDDYTETELKKWREELEQLRKNFEKPISVDIIDNDQTQTTIPLIQLKERQATVKTPAPSREIPTITPPIRSLVKTGINDKWIQHGVTVAGGYGPGNRYNQLYGPRGIYMDYEKTLYIADNDNHRIVEWKYGVTGAQVIAGGNGRGSRVDRLDNPIDVVVDKKTDSIIICDRNNRRVMRWSRQNRIDADVLISNLHCQGLTIDHEGFLYVSDSGKHEVRRYRVGETTGIVVAGGHGKGDHLNQLNFPTNIFVDEDHSLYVSDSNNHRIIKWKKNAKEGIVVAGGHGQGNKNTQLSNPRGIIVDSLGTVYVVDGWNHRVMRWCSGATQGELIIGGNGQGEQANQFNYPEALAFDRDGNIYVADCLNHRIQRFNIQNNLY